MAPDLPEKLLGIDIDPVTDQRDRDRSDREEPEERVRVVIFGVGEHRLAVPVDDVTTTTDVPADLTRVPRTPEAIEGVTDLRGEITAVIDPTVYFPTDDDRSDRPQLLVFDCPDDEQSAALRVDDVLAVDSIPESDVLTADDVADRSLSGDALDHPLVEALVERSRRRRAVAGVTPGVVGANTPDGVAADDDRADGDRSRRRVVELVPLVDVDALRAASGHLVANR